MSRDLTTGSLPKHIVSMALPSMFGMVSQSLYDIVDMIWIGRFSAQAVAAVTIYVTIFWLLEVLNEIIGMSSVSLISQSYGAGNRERTRRAAEQTLLFKFTIATLAALLIMVILKPAMHFFSDDPEVIQLGLDYGVLRTVFIPVFFSSYSVNTIFRCTGDAKTPMYLLLTSSILNIVLDPVLMFTTIPVIGIPGLGMGVRGAAVATVISMSIAFLAGFIILMRGKKGHIKLTWQGIFTFNRELDWKLLTIGLPSGLEMLFRNTANTLILKIVAIYGTGAVAVYGVGTRIFGLMFMPVLGLLMGAGAITGQNIGANKLERAERTAWYSAWFGFLVVGVIAIPVMAYPGQILQLFLPHLEDVRLAVSMFRFIAPGIVLVAFGLGFATVFSGAGLTMPFLYSCLLSRWLVQLPLSWAAVSLLHLPLDYIWAVFLISDTIETVYMVIVFKRGKWRNRKV